MIYERLIDDIKNDTNSGATELTIKANEALLSFIQENTTKNKEEFLDEFIPVTKKIINSQLTMASIFNLCNKILIFLEKIQDRPLNEIKKELIHEAEGFRSQIERGLKLIAENGQKIIGEGDTILTISTSTTVAEILRNAHATGKNFRVIVLESRPYFEGKEMARFLGRCGLHCEVILDAAIGNFIKEVNCIIVGADRVAEEFFVNKIGSYLLALASKDNGIDFYVACEKIKFLPSNLQPVKDIPEVVAEEWGNVRFITSTFEKIPNKFVTGFIQESGIITSKELKILFKDFKVASYL